MNVELTSLSGATVMTYFVSGSRFWAGRQFLNEAFPSLSTFQGIVRISTNSPAGISVIGLRGRYNERNDFLITTSPPVNENAPGIDELLFPHIVDGGGYSTQFVLFGAAGQPTAATIRFLSQTGGGLGLRLGD